ncbi:MAG TPA: c-type cytochrome [Woeseiaceae bacterium]
MNIRQARHFAIISTAISAFVFLALTADSHRQFPELTNEENLTPEVGRGMDVWHEFNCINCHTLFGEGAYYAPDLTKIAELRGRPYLEAYMRDPSQFYDENVHRRLMPKQDLSDQQIADLVSFLDWVSQVDNQGWPPRPIYVTGGLTRSAVAAAQANEPTSYEARPVTADSAAIARGENLFHTAVPACNACHSTQRGADMAGPSLAGVATRAAQVIGSPDYTGEATDVESYIRESIRTPSAHLVPGAMYSANGVSFMPDTYPKTLTDEQIDDLAAFLASFR